MSKTIDNNVQINILLVINTNLDISVVNNKIRDTYLDLDSLTLLYIANCNVTVAVTYLELDNVTSKLDTNFLCTSSKSVN